MHVNFFLAFFRGGTYGKLRVFFSTSQLTLVALATSNGVTAVNYYESPVRGKQSRTEGTMVDISSQTNKVEVNWTRMKNLEIVIIDK